MTDTALIQSVCDRFPYGIFVLSARDAADRAMGVVVTWVMQVSFEPPLVAIAVEKEGPLADILEPGAKFCLSLVESGDMEGARGILKTRGYIEQHDAGALFVSTEGGVPALQKSSGVLSCEALQTHDAGDHFLVVGRVAAASAGGLQPMMTLQETGWKYRRKTPAR